MHLGHKCLLPRKGQVAQLDVYIQANVDSVPDKQGRGMKEDFIISRQITPDISASFDLNYQFE